MTTSIALRRIVGPYSQPMTRRSDELRQRLVEQFERAAHVFEISAELAEQHAESQRRLGRTSDEAQERERAQFAQAAAERARQNALALMDPREPRS
jgi:hypothetical protein